MIERRRHPRVKLSHTALYFSDTYPTPRVAKTVDLSLGGTRIETTPYGLIPGEDLELSIVIHPEVIKCRGKVIHILKLPGERQQAGVRFESMSKHDSLYLGEHISSIIEQQN
jgi:hypothetical protein